MFYSLLRIGEAVRKGTEEDVFVKLPKEGDLCTIIFDSDAKRVKCDRKRLGAFDHIEYAYKGEPSARKPQTSATTVHPEYILGFYPTGKKKKLTKEKFAPAVISERLGDSETGQLLKRVLAWYDPEKYKEQILNECEFDCAAYTIGVIEGGNLFTIAKMEDYRKLLTIDGEVEDGICQFCGRRGVLKNPNYPDGTLLKIFVVDKKGFLPGLDASAASIAHSVCPECRRKLVLGDRYVEDNLKVSVRGVNIYVIPDMSVNAGLDYLNKFEVNNEGYIFDRLKQLYISERTAEDIAESVGQYARLTFVIGNREQAKFRVRRVIPEVRYLRLIEIFKAFIRAEGTVFKSLKRISFKELYDVLPMEKTGAGSDPKFFIEFFDSMLTGTPLEKSYVYSTFLKSIRCHRFGTCANGYTLKYSFEQLVLLEETYIYAMALLKIMSLSVKEQKGGDLLGFADSIGLSEGLKGVFLLGVLTAYVGYEQYKKGDEKKAVLDKIDYEGMDYHDIVTFSTRLFESLRDYNILSYETEKLYYEAISRIKSGSKDLSDPQENVFHLLLGYSYKTYEIMTHRADES